MSTEVERFINQITSAPNPDDKTYMAFRPDVSDDFAHRRFMQVWGFEPERIIRNAVVLVGPIPGRKNE